uniref:Peptidase A1 domain-containing protein n=1 Tax=Brugia pahangi TaxID=6280 RepID=A0A0N4T0A9_BRUPA
MDDYVKCLFPPGCGNSSPVPVSFDLFKYLSLATPQSNSLYFLGPLTINTNKSNNMLLGIGKSLSADVFKTSNVFL